MVFPFSGLRIRQRYPIQIQNKGCEYSLLELGNDLYLFSKIPELPVFEEESTTEYRLSPVKIRRSAVLGGI